MCFVPKTNGYYFPFYITFKKTEVKQHNLGLLLSNLNLNSVEFIIIKIDVFIIIKNDRSPNLLTFLYNLKIYREGQ